MSLPTTSDLEKPNTWEKISDDVVDNVHGGDDDDGGGDDDNGGVDNDDGGSAWAEQGWWACCAGCLARR